MKKRLLLPLVLALVCAAVIACAETQDYRAFLRERLSQGVRSDAADIIINAAEYSALSMPEAETLPDGTLSTGTHGYVEYTVTVPEAALYTVTLRYFPGIGTGGDAQREITVNGQLQFREAGELVFNRLWNDKSRDYQNASGNQPFPSQVETPEFVEVACRDALGYVTEPFLFYFEAGENTLRLTSLAEGLILSRITLAGEKPLKPYAEYIASALAEGVAYADIAPIKIQAEDAALKSSPSFYPINDRTSPLSEPYHPSNIVLNAIGGTAWNEPGEWIAWDVDIPQDGLYRVALRFKQSEMRGLYATRLLRVNGEIPFFEASDLRFYYSTSFQFSPLSAIRSTPADTSATEEYWIYLKKGTNRITLEVSLGALGEVLSDLEVVTGKLNALYREIIAITGTLPDVYRDYQLYVRIPRLRGALSEYALALTDVQDRLTALMGAGNERTAGITRLLSIMESFGDNSEEIVKKLASFKECVTAMGKATLDIKDQPLKLDYLVIAGKDLPAVQAEGNFFQMAGHTIAQFAGSFTNDYNVAASALTESRQTIDVWLSTGRDQFEVIRRLINESFEPETGIRVNLKLINADVLLPSTFTGRGPDIALQIANSAPVNFAYRDAAYDISQFADYAEVAGQFLPAAMQSFYYNNGCYALPDQMSFPVMFYRTDILDSMGLSAPETWDDLIALIPHLQRENMEIYLDTAPVATLGAAISMGNSKAINTVFLAKLFQLDGSIYSESGDECVFGAEEANVAFKWWTQFYTQHGFPREIDFVTRFRIGEVPIGVVDLSTYNRLAVSAPEIRGAWAIAPVPGTRLADGTIARDVPCVTGASMIIKNMVEKKGTQEAAWTFLKWWTGAETQTRYAREMEAVLGTAGRYLVANLEAFETISWPMSVKTVLSDVLTTLHGIPQVPGGYITGRYLDNAFVTVITEYENPSDTLYEYTLLINEEITAKRKEFGLSVIE